MAGCPLLRLHYLYLWKEIGAKHLASVTCFPALLDMAGRRITEPVWCEVKRRGNQGDQLQMIQKGNLDWQFQGCKRVSCARWGHLFHQGNGNSEITHYPWTCQVEFSLPSKRNSKILRRGPLPLEIMILTPPCLRKRLSPHTSLQHNPYTVKSSHLWMNLIYGVMGGQSQEGLSES